MKSIEAKINAANRRAARKAANPEKQREYVRRSKAKARAAMTEEQLEHIRKQQRVSYHSRPMEPRPKVCSVCGRDGRICIDHCHATSRFRGWLCEGCNTALGRVGDDPAILRALAEYIERSRLP